MTNSIKAILLLSGAALLPACGNDTKAANDANFERALNTHYAQMKQCVKIGSEPNADGIIQEFRTDGSIKFQITARHSYVLQNLIKELSAQARVNFVMVRLKWLRLSISPNLRKLWA